MELILILSLVASIAGWTAAVETHIRMESKGNWSKGNGSTGRYRGEIEFTPNGWTATYQIDKYYVVEKRIEPGQDGFFDIEVEIYEDNRKLAVEGAHGFCRGIGEYHLQALFKEGILERDLVFDSSQNEIKSVGSITFYDTTEKNLRWEDTSVRIPRNFIASPQDSQPSHIRRPGA